MFDRVPSWQSLRGFGEMRLVRTSYVWLVAVPLLARVLAPLPAEVSIEIFGASVAVQPRLPFSWQMFFLAALSFSGFTGLYRMSCPTLVRDFESFADFRERGEGSLSLLAMLMTLVRGAVVRLDGGSSVSSEEFLQAFVQRFAQDLPSQVSVYRESDAGALLVWKSIAPDNMADAFTEVRYISNWTAPAVRAACVAALAAGLCFSGVVLGQNVRFVLTRLSLF